MRSLTTTFIWIVSLNVICAQVPLGFSFQTIIRDNEGKVLKNQATGIQFSILEGSATGTVVYSETHTVSTNDFGVINLTVGTGTVTSGVFSDIVWGSNIHFLKTEIDPTGGNIYTISTTSQLMSVPYAMYAMKADTAINTNIPNTANDGDILYYKDGSWNQLNKGNQGDFLRINEVGEPVWRSFAGYVSDIDGNSYPLIKIGDQIWFQENLRVSKLNNGISIQYENNPENWISINSPAWGFPNGISSNDDNYGKLYNWYAASSNICPSGFKVPTMADFIELSNFLGDNAGGKLKSNNDIFWINDNINATNESGFTAYPAGYLRAIDQVYANFGLDCLFYARDELNTSVGNYILIFNGTGYIYFNAFEFVKESGMSIRCIKD
jgi:uncharacterized protein (TIGR02145 family)